MVSELKVSKSYSLNPTVISWATQKAALLSLREGRSISASEVINDILAQAMNDDAVAEDVEHLKKFFDKKLKGKK